MKRNALSHRAAPLREPVLLHPIPNARSESQFFFSFFMTTPLSEKRRVLITPSSSQLESQKFLHGRSKNYHCPPPQNFKSGEIQRKIYPLENQFRVTKPAQANIRQVPPTDRRDTQTLLTGLERLM